jgi:sugar phosphate permease
MLGGIAWAYDVRVRTVRNAITVAEKAGCPSFRTRSTSYNRWHMKNLHYAWAILAVTFLALLTSAAVRSTPGALMVPLEDAFGWSRATISVAVSLSILLYGLIGPFAAGFISIYGPRRVMATGLMLVGSGVLCTLAMRQSWQLVLLWGVVVGVGTGIVAVVLGALIVQRWFHLHRGLALGLLTASSATGQLLFLPFIAYLIEIDGWRAASLTMAIACFAILPLVLLLMRDEPRELSLTPLGLPPGALPDTPAASTRENPFIAALAGLREASGRREFWVLAGSFFICGASTNGLIGTHLIPACMDHGIPEVQAAGLLALMGVFDIVGTTGSGWLSDRLDNRLLLFAYYGLRGLALLYLPYGFQTAGHGLSIFAVFYGLDWIATVPPTVGLTRQAFGASKVGVVFGWVLAAHQVGAAAAASFAGLMRTHEGSYDHAFQISGGLCIVTALALLLLRGRHRKTVVALDSRPALQPGVPASDR